MVHAENFNRSSRCLDINAILNKMLGNKKFLININKKSNTINSNTKFLIGSTANTH